MSLELRSTVTKEGTLELSLADVAIPEPQENEVLIRVEGAPINPSDLGLLLGPAAKASFAASAEDGRPKATATISAEAFASVQQRVDKSMPVGNEGAGTVVKAGASPAAQALLGKVVSFVGAPSYTQYKTQPAEKCLALPEGVTPAQGASWFVNPMTVLAFVETMRKEGHTALVHTAAASNLGQMLAKVCLADGIGLVNIVRKQEQADLLRGLGCEHVVISTSPDFMQELTAACVATGATLGFDAIGGGPLAGNILSCMEEAAKLKGDVSTVYGSNTYKQVYIYGGLDRSPTDLKRNFGLSWGLGGWLLTPFLMKNDPAMVQRMKDRVAAEITTTFKSEYTREVSLFEVLDPECIAAYAQQATGQKFLINPSKDAPAS